MYFLTNGNNIKIGYTKNSIKTRLKQLNTGSDLQLYILGFIYGDIKTEKNLHNKFQNIKLRENGEWFLATDELIDYINSVNELKNTTVIKNELFNNRVIATLSI